ncbi:MAG: hypothetical protein HYY32_03625 [Chloroflexi bacterium]|nr:hypothetical protein [Chloroflexota bacterium]
MKIGLNTSATRADKVFAVLGLFLLLGLAFAYSGQKRTGVEVAALRRQVESATRELRDAQGAGSVEAARKRLNDLRVAALAFPTSSQAEEVAGSLWTWAQDSVVNLEQMGYTVTNTQLGDWSYPAHNFPLSGKGAPDKVAGFLRLLEAAPQRTTGISQLLITPGQGSVWQFSLTFTVWSQATKIEKKAGS